MSREPTIVDTLQAQADTAALGAKIGVDLTGTYNEFATEGQTALRLDATAWGRAGADGTQNIETAQRNGTHNGITNDKKEQYARILNSAISAVELNQLILNISLEIEEVTEQIAAIEARQVVIRERQVEIEAQQEEIRAETAERTEEVAVLEETLDDVNATDLAIDRATADLMRADAPEAVAMATTALEGARLSHEDALESARELLGADATLTDVEIIRLSLENQMADISVRLHTLSTESERLRLESEGLDAEAEGLGLQHSELTARLGELEASRDALIALRPEDIENGAYTNEQIIGVLPEDMQASYMDHLTGMLETGWEYTQEFAENTITALSTRLSSTLESIGLGGVFSNAHDDVAPEALEPVQVAQAPSSSPVLQTNTI